MIIFANHYIIQIFSMKKYLILIFLFVIIPCTYAQNPDLDKLYTQLDGMIANSQKYIDAHKANISLLKTQFKKSKTDMERYNAGMKLFNDYKSYINDSAVAVMQQCRQLAVNMRRKDLEGKCLSLIAFQCSTVGMYEESLTLLKQVSRRALSPAQLPDYYIAYNHVYGEMGYYTNIKDLKSKYYVKSADYEDSLFRVLDKNSTKYLMYKSRKLYNNKEYDAALKLNAIWQKRVGPDSREYAVVAYYRYLIYNIQGNVKMAKYWLASSAISDLKHAVMDQGSLWSLANILDNEGDLDRAYQYVSFSWNCALVFGTRVRSYQISPILTVIEKNYQAKIRQTNRQLLAFTVVISVMALLFLLLLMYVNKQRGRLAVARNELKAINAKLEILNAEFKTANIELDESNRKLLNSNTRLNESNRVKEEYIGRFLSLCSQYVDKLDDYRKMVNKKMKNKELDDLFQISRSTEFKEKEIEELYANFDSVFIHLFPNFVDDYNAMLKPEVQSHPKDVTKLTTDIRIFALIRLGIDDSSKIADFLHYSVNTIYNYRARIKNGAMSDRENFEKRVKELGLNT